MSDLFGIVALLFFPLSVTYAGFSDLATMRIPNRLVLVMLVGFVILAPLAGFSVVQLGLGLAAALCAFGLGFAAFALGGMGGGDVKLMAVSAMWLGLPQLPAFLLITALAGALLTVAFVAYRSLPLPSAILGLRWASWMHTTVTQVPYGVAIALGSLIVFTASPWMALG